MGRFAGTSRHVADFLSEDVLARKPDAVIGFLLHTCVLEELTASLCAALTGTSGADAEAALVELERGNLFVVPLDQERLAWRTTTCSPSTCGPSSPAASRSSSRSCTGAPGAGTASTAWSGGRSRRDESAAAALSMAP